MCLTYHRVAVGLRLHGATRLPEGLLQRHQVRVPRKVGIKLVNGDSVSQLESTDCEHDSEFLSRDSVDSNIFHYEYVQDMPLMLG